jgi:hypothetical protein
MKLRLLMFTREASLTTDISRDPCCSTISWASRISLSPWFFCVLKIA